MTNPLMPHLVGPDGSVNEEALALAMRALIDYLEQLPEAVSIASRYNWEILLLADELMSHATGVAQAAWLVELNTGYRVAYSDLGSKRLAWAIHMENNENNNHENDELCEGAA